MAKYPYTHVLGYGRDRPMKNKWRVLLRVSLYVHSANETAHIWSSLLVHSTPTPENPSHVKAYMHIPDCKTSQSHQESHQQRTRASLQHACAHASVSCHFCHRTRLLENVSPLRTACKAHSRRRSPVLTGTQRALASKTNDCSQVTGSLHRNATRP